MARFEEISALVACSARDEGLAVGESYPQLVRTWQSRTATLYHFRVDQSADHDLIVKLLDTPEQAIQLYDGMCKTACRLEKNAWRESIPLWPRGLSEEFGAVLMPYIHGRTMEDLLKKERLTSPDKVAKALKYMANCGVILAAYHAEFEERGESVLEMAWDNLKRRISAVLGPKIDIKKPSKDAILAQRYWDFGLSHLIIATGGKLALIDPPLVEQPRYVYTDLAHFTHSIFAVLWHPASLSRGLFNVRHHASLEKEFLGGYTKGLDRSLTDEDRFFIFGCEAFLIKRHLLALWTKRTYTRFAYYAIPLSYRFNRLKRAMLHLL